MHVELLDFVSGARAARGIAIVIDVFRAFSLAPYAVAAGARVVPVAGVDEAYALKAAHPDWLIAGERNAQPLPGFDFGNSPAQVLDGAVAGRTLIHTTHAGTQGLTRADGADEVLTGSLVNAAALVRYVRARRPACVSIVRMGYQARERSLEDDTCAQILAARLAGERLDEAGLVARLSDAPAAAKFHDPAATYAPLADLGLCLALDRFDFVLRLAPPDAEGLRFLARVDA